MLPNKGQKFFELPETAIRGIPFFDSSGERLELGLVEVGCKPRKKKRDLSDKKQLIYKWWSDTYRRKGIVDWLPQVYRTLVHYHPGMDPSLYGRRNQLDVVILYTEISQEMLGSLTDEEKTKIYLRMGKEEKLSRRPDLRRVRQTLERIIETRDARKLHQMIVSGGNNQKTSALRGVMAEVLAQRDVEYATPPGMNCFKNGDVRYFNRRYINGTEIDAISTSYKEEIFVEFVENLRRLDHIVVKDRWHA